MLNRFFIFTFLLLLSFDCIAQSEGYFEHIAVVSDGRLTRFSNMPISIYVKNPESNENYLSALEYALKEWEEQSAGIIKFRMAETPDGADILLSWVTKFEVSYREHPLGIAELHRIDRNKFYVELQICVRDPITAKQLSVEQQRSVLLHEIGHAIGLWGHSKDKSDVMYYAATAQKPTINDIMTLKQVYSYENGYQLYEQSIKSIEEDIKSNPSYAMAYFLLGTIYIDQGKYDLGIDALKKCLIIDPEYHKARVALASAYKNIGQGQLAITEYINLSKSEPSAMIYNVIATSYYNNGDIEQAIFNYKKALEIDKTYEPAKQNLIRLYVSKGNDLIKAQKYQEAMNIFSEGARMFPNKPEMLNGLGACYSEMGLYEEALNQFKLALNYNPAFEEARFNVAACYNNIGIKYSKSNQWEKAIEAYNQALVYSPDLENAKQNISSLYWNRAVYLASNRDDRSALNAYLEYIKIEPNSRDAYNNLGAVYSRLGMYSESINALEHALEIDPNSQEVIENLSIAYQRFGFELMQKKSYDLAIKELKKALELTPNDADICVLLAVNYDHINKIDDSIQYIEKALRLDPKNENANKVATNLMIQKGNECLESNDYDGALKAYIGIPSDMMTYQIRNNIAYIYIMKGMYMEAIEQIDYVLESEPNDKTANNNLLSVESKLSKIFMKDNSEENRDKLARAKISKTISLITQGNLIKAKQTMKSALDLGTKNKDILILMNKSCEILLNKLKQKGINNGTEEVALWLTQINSILVSLDSRK